MGNSGPIAGALRPKPGANWSAVVDTAGLAKFLRDLHPDKTALNVAAETGLPPDTVKKWLATEATPNGRALLVLACAYGPEVMCAMLVDPPDWLDAAARAAQQERLRSQLDQLQARLERASEQP